MRASPRPLRAAIVLGALAVGGCPDPEPRTRSADVPDARRAPPDVAPRPPDTAPDLAPDVAPAPDARPEPAAKRGATRAPAPAEPTGAAMAALGKIAVKGDLPRPEVERVLRGLLPAFRACYEGELASNPRLTGRLLIDLTIGPTGAVSLVDVKTSTLGGGNAETCIANAARRVRWKARPGAPEVVATFPLELRRRR
jgi:hypothetical protein